MKKDTNKVFTEDDCRLRACTSAEIGLPWEERWNVDDFLKGECSTEQVGVSRLVKALPPTVPAILSQAERSYLLQLAQDEILRLFHKNPAVFLADNASNANKILDLALKAEERKAPDPLDGLTDNDLSKISLDDLKRLTLRFATDDSKGKLFDAKGIK